MAGLFLEKKFLFLFGLCIRRRQPFIYISNIKELKFYDFFSHRPHTYTENGDFLPYCFNFYLIQTYDPYSYELEQLVSSNDGYKVGFQYVLSYAVCISYMTWTHES